MRAAIALQRQQGSTLIEVLVTLLVVTVGLLGHAGLLVSTLKKNNDAFHRTQVTLLTSDIMESMRANRPAALSGDYNVAVGTAPAGGSLAVADLSRWKTNLGGALPAGDGSVSVDLQGNATIVIQWDGNGNGTPSAFITQGAI